MLIVDIAKLQSALDILRIINATKLEDIIWANGPEPIETSEEEIAEFKYIGLNNVDFARSYKGWVK